jgi:hypothetical protein
VCSAEAVELGDVLVGLIAVDGDLRKFGIDPVELVAGEGDVDGAEVLLDAGAGKGRWRPSRAASRPGRALSVSPPGHCCGKGLVWHGGTCHPLSETGRRFMTVTAGR